MASTTLVNTADAAELRLVHYLGDHAATSPFVLSCETAITQADAAALLTTVSNHTPAIDKLLLAPAEEGVGAFSLLSALLDRIEDASVAQQVMKGLVAAVESNGNNSGEVVSNKIGLLCALYNLRSGTEKCWILGRILHYAAFSGDEESILSLLPGRNSTLGQLLEGNNLEKTMMGFEGVDPADTRALYFIASNAVGKVAEVCKAKGMGQETTTAGALKQRFLLKMLGTYKSASDINEEALDAAIQAAIGAISNPVTLFAEQRCIMSLLPVSALKDQKPIIHSLLSIFQQGKLEDFQSFIKTNPSACSDYNISEEEAIRHMRLLSLCSLATEHEEIPYDAIAATLQVDQSEVEGWVIAAVSSGLVSAKMDQLQHVVMVERCVVRKFGIEQWKILQTRLDAWKTNVKTVLDGLKQSQAGLA